jgi:hypothetical protein
MGFIQANILLAAVFAFTYLGMGKFEVQQRGGRNPGPWWALMSIAISALFITLFNAGWLLVLFAQIGLFVGITIWRTLREK